MSILFLGVIPNLIMAYFIIVEIYQVWIQEFWKGRGVLPYFGFQKIQNALFFTFLSKLFDEGGSNPRNPLPSGSATVYM